jgi:hypothetical protein
VTSKLTTLKLTVDVSVRRPAGPSSAADNGFLPDALWRVVEWSCLNGTCYWSVLTSEPAAPLIWLACKHCYYPVLEITHMQSGS